MVHWGSANGIGTTVSPASGFDDWATWNKGAGADFENYASMANHIFTNAGASSNVPIVKMFMGPSNASAYYSAESWGSPATLKALAQETQFDNVFGDADHTIFLLDCFTWNDNEADKWRAGTIFRDTPTYFTAEYTEVYDLVKHLLDTYSGKTFIIQDQEQDWSLLGRSDHDLTKSYEIDWPRVNQAVAWCETRRRAVHDAVKAAAGSTSAAYYATEPNRVVDCLSTYTDGSENSRRWSNLVLARARCDFVCWSAYDGLYQLQSGESAWGSSEAQFVSEFGARITDGVAYLREVTGAPVIISELGLNLATMPGAYSEATIVTALHELLEGLGVWGVAWWSVLNNGVADPTAQYGLFTDAGSLTTSASTLMGLV